MNLSINTATRADGLKAVWRGKKFEDRYTQVALCLWENLESSHAFFTSAAYGLFHKAIQPALNGRKVDFLCHALLDHSALSDYRHLEDTLNSPAIEVALTKVVDGGVSGYYSQFEKVVKGILTDEPGCDGFFISPLIEDPHDQLLLINWKSVDVKYPRHYYYYFMEIRTDCDVRHITRNLRRSLDSELASMHCMIIIGSL